MVDGDAAIAIALAPVPHALEARDAVLAAGKRLAVDDARACAQASEGLDDHGKAVG
jgi:hypothetical protein